MSDFDQTDLGRRLASLRGEIEPVDVQLHIDLQRRRPLAHIAAAVLLVLAAGLVVIAPARTAVADWLGIGSTSIDIEDELPPATTIDPPATPSDDSASDIEQAASVQLPRHPGLGEPVGWEIRALEGGVRELVVDWSGPAGDIRLTAWSADADVSLRKIVTSEPVFDERLETDGDPAVWLSGPHVRDLGDDAVLVESTLLWVRGGIEYRLSGPALTLEQAVELAATQT
ncbi:MAG: hypothetical protein DHS20C19_15420 [Acidimicrobiales bacterium]|nr:MAG: hypothetical protein DHS20C19_15420 [Acidimicrobiales bacterium]